MEKCSQQIVCSQRYEPVCGSDSITYPNQCTFMLAKCNSSSSSSSLVVAYKGECCTSSCPGDWQPVCDNRHVTHEVLVYKKRLT
ncbi:unnamed protein product [Anisakis simplex]|uniref:Kazal-like domain-containing protein n=1 Tax=Anisakis simplex TaxID=6269 RepID=A0A0M3JRH5_ANISI|nr:unnamed protein product [Anisakis simplex]